MQTHAAENKPACKMAYSRLIMIVSCFVALHIRPGYTQPTTLMGMTQYFKFRGGPVATTSLSFQAEACHEHLQSSSGFQRRKNRDAQLAALNRDRAGRNEHRDVCHVGYELQMCSIQRPAAEMRHCYSVWPAHCCSYHCLSPVLRCTLFRLAVNWLPGRG